MILRLVASLLLSANSAETGHCPPDIATHAENRDGSTLSVHTLCLSESMRRHVLTLICPDGQVCDRLDIDQDIDEAPMGSARIVDLDGDDYRIDMPPPPANE